MLIRPASSFERSLIRSAARRSTATRSCHGTLRHERASSAAARTASSTSWAEASCTRHSSTEVSFGLCTSIVGPSVRGCPPTSTGRVVPNHDRAVVRPCS